MLRFRAALGSGCVALGVLGAGSPAASADELIGEYTSSAAFGYFGISHSAEIVTFLSPDFGVFAGEGTLFEGSHFVNGDHIVTELTYGDDPDFERYVELLTDGQDWWLYDQLNFEDGFMNGRFGLESDRLPLDDPPPDPNTVDPNQTLQAGPDLAGYQITRVVRTVDFLIDSPGHNPNGDGNWTDIEFTIQTDVYGVPEPSTMLMGALAGVWALRRRC